MGLRKAVKPEFGGGTRSFSCEEEYIYENIESELCFFTSQVSVSMRAHTVLTVHRSVMLTKQYLEFLPPTICLLQERQSIIKYWMDNLRAKQGEVLHNIYFLEGQPISKLHPSLSDGCLYSDTWQKATCCQNCDRNCSLFCHNFLVKNFIPIISTCLSNYSRQFLSWVHEVSSSRFFPSMSRGSSVTWWSRGSRLCVRNNP